MTRSCPLPVDWLDYLEGIGAPALAEHLAGCASCQTLVSSLQANRLANLTTDWAKPFVGRTDAVWHEERLQQPALAEFWFSAPSFDLDTALGDSFASSQRSNFAYNEVDRVLLLVVSHPRDDHSLSWLDVVPVLSDVEQATETDLLFSAQENTLGSPWRALFAYQTKVAREQLDTRVGSLSEVGVATLLAALEGDLDEARWGVPLQGPDDPRAWLDEEFEQTLLRLRTPWLVVSGTGVADDDDDVPNPGLHLVATGPEPDLPDDSEAERAEVLWLRPVSESRHQFALAAASVGQTRKDLWVLDTNVLKLRGMLDVDWNKGLLVFFISAATLHRGVRLRLLVVARGEEYASEPFVPTDDTAVPLAQGVTKEAVERLGAEVIR